MIVFTNNLIFISDVLNSILYCGEFILDNIIIFSTIFIGVSGITILHASGGRWVKMVVNGVERLVLVTAGGAVINDQLGNPLGLPGSNSGNNNNTGNNNTGNNSGNNNSGNKTGENSGKK